MFDEAPRRSWRGSIALVCVIALHVALYLALRGSAGWGPRQTTRPAIPRTAVTLRLLPWPRPTAPTVSPEARSSTKAPPRRRAWAAITLTAPGLRGPVAPAAESTQAGASPLPEPPAPQPPRALDLALPRGLATRPRAGNPALDDPRGNSARLTPEQRLAAAFDTRVIEEDLGDGRRRIRRGANCVIVKQARIGQLMPFDDAAARTPGVVDACP